jgi:hypothetical protein
MSRSTRPPAAAQHTTPILLSLLMREAVADRRIGFNPCHGIRVSTGHRVERTPATAQQINRITDRIHRRSDQILVITAAYTGMRWGELAGLTKANVHLGDGLICIHRDLGALHEVGGRLWIGPPKSAAAVRDIHLPPFLTSTATTTSRCSAAPTTAGCAAPPWPGGSGGPPSTAAPPTPAPSWKGCISTTPGTPTRPG